MIRKIAWIHPTLNFTFYELVLIIQATKKSKHEFLFIIFIKVNILFHLDSF